MKIQLIIIVGTPHAPSDVFNLESNLLVNQLETTSYHQQRNWLPNDFTVALRYETRAAANVD